MGSKDLEMNTDFNDLQPEKLFSSMIFTLLCNFTFSIEVQFINNFFGIFITNSGISTILSLSNEGKVFSFIILSTLKDLQLPKAFFSINSTLSYKYTSSKDSQE